MITKIYARLIGAALVVAVAVAGGLYWRHLQAEAALSDQREAVAVTAQGIVADGAADDRQSAAVTTGVTMGREEFLALIKEANRNEPETAARSVRAVPDSVLRAYHQRRLTRERSVGDESERGAEPAPSAAAER